jgi:FMN phosphatase YigB (HAD superfamily)
MLSPSTPEQVVVLLDVDNTLLDNDRFAADLDAWLEAKFGSIESKRYWAIYASLRDELGYADYLGTVQRFRAGLDDDPALLQLAAYLLEYPFAKLVYPHALEGIAHVRTLARPVILSDGDVVFQPRKIQRSGLWDALRGDVLIYPHKQHALAAIQQRYPASHYVMVDDKPHLLAEMKDGLAGKLTTVFVRQGHYASASPAGFASGADLEIDHIAQLCNFAREDFLPAAFA